MTDYANTPHAAATRYTKAQQIAAWCWGNGLTPDHLMALTEPEWAALARRAVGKPASGDTQHLAYCFLEVKTAWAAAHRDHPDARRTVRTLTEVTADLTARRTRMTATDRSTT